MNTIDELLAQQPEAVQAALQSEWQKYASRPMVLFGAGPLGQITLEGLGRAGVTPVAFCDNKNSLWGTTVGGIAVLSPAEALQQHADAVFVVAIYNPSKVVEQLKSLGAATVVGAAPLFRAFPTLFPHGSFDSALPIFAESDAVREVGQLWGDDQSRAEYLAQLQWRTTPGYQMPTPPLAAEETYFPPELPLHDDEHFVDCGAFDGDSLRAFLAHAPVFQGATVFEPDVDNCARLERNLEAMPNDLRARIHVVNAAVGARNETLHFRVTGTAASTFAPEETTAVQCVRLDDALKDVRPTWIKMDIEGAEPDALEGAREMIRRARPVLAVCVYHETGHLWQIPLLMHQILPDYKLYLRRYAEECWELVVYAVPPERE